MSVFLFSDPHFYHENEAKRRGFSCADEMNELIVKNWNNTVDKKDCVFLLGDITMEIKNYKILSELNGTINVILGNHDQRGHVRNMLKYVSSVAGMIIYKKVAILTHCPVHPSNISYGSKFNIHGHIHDKRILKHPTLASYLGEPDPRYVNVCAEMINYTPVEYLKIIKDV